MAFYIQRPSGLDPNVTVYYTGVGRRWSDDPSDKKSWDNNTDPANLMHNPDGTNGGWSTATIVEE